MAQPTRDELQSQLNEVQGALAGARARIADLDAELVRTREWRRSALIAVVAVAAVAILMLGIVAFNAIDDQALGLGSVL